MQWIVELFRRESDPEMQSGARWWSNWCIQGEICCSAKIRVRNGSVLLASGLLKRFFRADSCTVFPLKANDGSIIVGRSMEFAVDLKYDVIAAFQSAHFICRPRGALLQIDIFPLGAYGLTGAYS